MNRQQDLDDGQLQLLMQRYQDADEKAACLLAEVLSGKLYRFFSTHVRDHHQAEDLLQECWLRIHKSRRSYRPGEPLLPWIFAIARCVQADHFRKGYRITQHEVQKGVEGVASAGTTEPFAQTCNVLELLKTLPTTQRETVVLLKVTGLSLEEVSRVTGVSVGAVKQRAHRAYTTLRRLLGGAQ